MGASGWAAMALALASAAANGLKAPSWVWLALLALAVLCALRAVYLSRSAKTRPLTWGDLKIMRVPADPADKKTDSGEEK